MGRRLPVRRSVAPRGRAQPGHPAWPDPRGHRRHRGRADDLAARGLRRRAQLGLPLLLAARRRADPRGADRRRAGSSRPTTGATGCSAPSPATPRTCRSCTPSTAAGTCPSVELDHLGGLRRLAPGPDRQRRGQAAPDRRARRGDVRAGRWPATTASTETRDTWSLQRTLVDPAGRDLAGARQRPLGDPRPAAPVHAQPGDGLGRLRPRGGGRREARPRGPRREWRGSARRGPRRGPRARLRHRAEHLHPALRHQRGRRLAAGARRTLGFLPGRRPAGARHASRRSSRT